MFLKTIWRGKQKTRKTALLASVKLNIIEKIISKAWVDSSISHEESRLVINDKKYQNKRQSRNSLIEYGKRIRIDEILKQN